MKKSTVQIDGWLYFLCALLAALLTYVSTEEAYKYIPVILLFWIKAIAGSTLTAFNALKAFRSSTFSRYAQQEQVKEDKKQKAEDLQTEFLTRKQAQENEKNIPPSIGG